MHPQTQSRDLLTARFLTRLTAGGTVDPRTAPMTRTHYSQLGAVYYPALSAVLADVIATWYGDRPDGYTGAYVAGFMAARFATAHTLARHLDTMGALELWINANGPQAHETAVSYLTAFIRNGGYSANFDGSQTLALIGSLL